MSCEGKHLVPTASICSESSLCYCDLDQDSLIYSVVDTSANNLQQQLRKTLQFKSIIGLDNSRKRRWEKTTQEMNFNTQMGRLRTFSRNQTQATLPIRVPSDITPGKIASHIVQMSRALANSDHTKHVKKKLATLTRNTPSEITFFKSFSINVINNTISDVRYGKVLQSSVRISHPLRHTSK